MSPNSKNNTHFIQICPTHYLHMPTSILLIFVLYVQIKRPNWSPRPAAGGLGGATLTVAKHRVLQREVVVKTGQAEVLGHQHVWDEGEAGLHGQDVRSQSEGDVSEQVRQRGGGFHCCCCWGGERCRLGWVAAGRLSRSRRSDGRWVTGSHRSCR